MGMNARKRIYLDINPAGRARLLASAGDTGDPAWGEVYLKLVGGAE